MKATISYSALFVRLYVLMVALAFGLGAALFIGQGERFSGPSLVGMSHLVAWVPLVPPFAVWGGMFVIYGLLLIMTMGRDRIAIHILRAGMVIYLFMVTGLVMAPFEEPRASLTGIVVYTVMFGCHAILSDHLSHRGWAEC